MLKSQGLQGSLIPRSSRRVVLPTGHVPQVWPSVLWGSCVGTGHALDWQSELPVPDEYGHGVDWATIQPLAGLQPLISALTPTSQAEGTAISCQAPGALFAHSYPRELCPVCDLRSCGDPRN